MRRLAVLLLLLPTMLPAATTVRMAVAPEPLKTYGRAIRATDWAADHSITIPDPEAPKRCNAELREASTAIGNAVDLGTDPTAQEIGQAFLELQDNVAYWTETASPSCTDFAECATVTSSLCVTKLGGELGAVRHIATGCLARCKKAGKVGFVHLTCN